MEGFLSDAVRVEFVAFMSAVFLGFVYGFIYDSVRILRRILPHRKVFFIAFEDIVYWLMVALHSYVSFYYETNGGIRGYIVVGLIAGAMLFGMSVGPIYVKYVTKFLKIVINALKKLFDVIKIYLEKIVPKTRGQDNVY